MSELHSNASSHANRWKIPFKIKRWISICFSSKCKMIIWQYWFINQPKNKKDGIGGSYRLASLDRLASRQRILEQNGGYGALSGNGTAATPTTNADKKNGLHKVDGVTNGSSSITHSVRQLCPTPQRDTTTHTFMNSEQTHTNTRNEKKNTHWHTYGPIEPNIVHPLTWPPRRGRRNIHTNHSAKRVPFNFLETIYTIVFDRHSYRNFVLLSYRLKSVLPYYFAGICVFFFCFRNKHI